MLGKAHPLDAFRHAWTFAGLCLLGGGVLCLALPGRARPEPRDNLTVRTPAIVWADAVADRRSAGEESWGEPQPSRS